ncbi:MAG: hypothetical protein BGP25_05440 [Lysobacterales bacterium 63-13]|nr:MAG: hypothetical protein BGP25_05440 [Xanthomonadales bacterium 63-13]
MTIEKVEGNDGWSAWLVVWPILTALIGSGITYWMMQQQRLEDLSLRPPIVVMEVSDWIQYAGEGRTDEERFKNGGERADAAARKLKEQGVLVLDSRIVRAAPAQVFVTTPRSGAARE